MTLAATDDIASYEGTVFISYARADDERPPFDEATRGWVTFFWHQLRFELTDRGVHKAELWLDRYEIEPAEDFTEAIDAALAAAKILILIMSPNWGQRPWCVQEFIRFSQLNADARDRMVLVRKLDPPAGMKLPPGLKEFLETRQGYQFFTREPSGEIVEFYWRGLKDQNAYFAVIRKIAQWIAAQLMLNAPAPQPRRAAPTGKAVYLAAPADELRDAWQRLANDLEGAGYEVLPAKDRLPDTAPAAEAAARAALAKAVVSVHLLGESEGGKPDGGEETLTRLQLRLARERVAPGFTRILWAPKWLGDRTRPKRDPFEVVQRFGALMPGEEVYGEEVTDLSQWLRGRLAREEEAAPKPAPAAGSAPLLIVASADGEDDELVSTLANRVQSPEIKVHPLFAGDPPVPGAAALVLWGKAGLPAVTALLTALEPLPSVVLRLPGGDETVKRRFFREGVYSERVDALPADRKAGRDLIARLEILPALAGTGA